jgi:arsenical pump membrane protein
MTALPRIAWTERSGAEDRLLLVVDLRPVAGVAVGAILLAAPLLAAPLGRLSLPFALLVVLPPLALSLEAFGWRDRLAARLASIARPLPRLLATYSVWLITSAVLTLDVAAVAAASVGIAVAGEREEERRWHLGGAILGANVGSLLLPFSNLTNLVLVSATGMGVAAYVGLAVWPQVAAALAVGLLFAVRARRTLAGRADQEEARQEAAPSAQLSRSRADHAAGAAGGVAIVGALAAIGLGLAGGDMAVPFAMSAGLLASVAVATRRLEVRALARSVPLAGLTIIGIAAVASGPIELAAGLLPRPDASLGGLFLALAVGSGLAAVANNLPAAAFGAIWLAWAHPASIMAYLIGTNVAALATPHGSVATILARAVGGRHGVETPTRTYLRSAWRYASVGAIAGVVTLALLTR